MSMLQVTVLGSGTSTGVPVIGCDCAFCQDTNSKNKRLRSSVLLTANGKNIVIDTSPEFRLQMLQAQVKSIVCVLYTHIHADHCHGFDDLRMFAFHKQSSPIDCYMSADFMPEFKEKFRYAFTKTAYSGTVPQVTLHDIPEKPFQVAGLNIESLRLPHGNILTNAFRIGSFAYATDFKSFSPGMIARWQNKIDTMIISGVRFRPHKTHSSIPESIEVLKALGVRRGYLTHLSHEVDYHKHRSELPTGVEFAYDGLVIELSA